MIAQLALVHQRAGKTLLQIDYTHQHGAARIERRVLESPTRIEAAHEIAQAGVSICNCGFEDGPFVGIDPNAQNRGGVR